MKTKILSVLALITACLVLLSSCEKDESSDKTVDDPCAGVTCLNGGTCINGECDCPEGFTGPDCGTQVTPIKMRISKIKITRFPTYNNGAGWDLWSAGPDIYVVIYRGSHLIHTQPTFFEDADATLDYTYYPSFNIDISDPTAQHEILLYDYDSTSSDDFMGGIYFYPYSSTAGFPSTLFVDAGGSLAFQLDVVYVW